MVLRKVRVCGFGCCIFWLEFNITGLYVWEEDFDDF